MKPARLNNLAGFIFINRKQNYSFYEKLSLNIFDILIPLNNIVLVLFNR